MGGGDAHERGLVCFVRGYASQLALAAFVPLGILFAIAAFSALTTGISLDHACLAGGALVSSGTVLCLARYCVQRVCGPPERRRKLLAGAGGFTIYFYAAYVTVYWGVASLVEVDADSLAWPSVKAGAFITLGYSVLAGFRRVVEFSRRVERVTESSRT